MSKLLRSELKTIVKECLIEILSEGLLGQNSLNENLVMTNTRKSKQRKPTRKKLSYLDKIKVGNKKENKIKTNLTSDPILNEILADTAGSTLSSQLAAEGKNRGAAMVSVQGDEAAKIVDKASPEDLFGDTADKWASLAFS